MRKPSATMTSPNVPSIGVGADGDVVSIGSLYTAELRDQHLCATHLQTIDNVNNLH